MLTSEGWWRGHRLARLELNPLVAGSAGRAFLAEELEVSLTLPPASLMPATEPLQPEELALLRQAINFDHGQRWRQPRFDRVEPAAVPFADALWAARIYLTSAGMYRLSYEWLRERGVDLDAVPPQQLRLYHRGQEQPMFWAGDTDSSFSAEEALWFYGERLAGDDGSWFNDEAAANVYWLVASPQPGSRFRERRLGTDSGNNLRNSFWQWAHFEEDRLYHSGDTDADIFTTDRVDGEGWIWQRLLPGQTLATRAELFNVVTEAPPCTLVARVRGITRDIVKPNHHVQIAINGAIVADARFNDTETLMLREPFPASVLRGGFNEVEIRSLGDTGARIDQFYVDWFKIGYWRGFVAFNNGLEFPPPPAASGERQRYQVSNFHSAAVFLFDLARGERLLDFTVSSPTPTSHFINFADDLTSPHRYLALAPPALREPDSLQLDQPTAWRTSQHQADMIIVSHRHFLSQAQRLADYRQQHNGLRTVVIDIQDVYDEFSAGIPAAQALRNFFTHAWANWRAPAPRYALLLGDGSWDAKKNGAESRKASFIPVYGNPVSDSRFVCVDGPGDILPDLFIGRLPAETPAQATAMVDKIIAYEAQPVPDWGKEFVFLNGGINEFEQDLFLRQSEGLIRRYVEAAPVAGRPARIYKSSEGRFAGELLPDILAAIDRGALMVTFSGHAGSQTWELMMVNADIPLLQNHDRLPFIASMTCHTARFANPQQNSFGEDFLRLPERGAIAFWGTSGWGYVFQDGVLLDGMFQAITQDSVRSIGAATTLGKLHLWRAFGDGITNRSVIDQYTLLGDPALGLVLPSQPDLAITAGDITFTPAAPSELDSMVASHVVVRNRGLASTIASDVHLRARATDALEPAFEAVQPLGPVGYADTLHFRWPGSGRRGAYLVEAEVDRESRIDELTRINNRAQASLYFYSSVLSLASPRELEVVPAAQPLLHVYNPELPAAGERRYHFEIDSSAGFNSPLRMSSGPVTEQPVRTTWQVPVALADGSYYWRSRTEENGVFGIWQSARFTIETGAMAGGFRQQGDDWRRSQGEFARSGRGVTLPPDPQRQLQLQVQSGGFYDLSRCYLIIDGQVVNEGQRGHNLLAIDPVSLQPLGPARHFDTYGSTAAADSMAVFLEALPLRTLLLAGIRDEGSQAITERAHQALAQFGSRHSRAVGLRDSWALIGAKGMAPGEAAEVHTVARSGQAVASQAFQPFRRTGSVLSPAIGPALAWQHLRIDAGVAHKLAAVGARGTGAEYVVLGRLRAGEPWQELRRLADLQADLSSIDAGTFPYLQLQAELRDDDGLDSPEIQAWSVYFAPAGDVVLTDRQMRSQADSLQPGRPFPIVATLFAFGELAADSVQVDLLETSSSGEGVVRESKMVRAARDAGVEVAFAWSAERAGDYALRLRADPDDRLPEPFEHNNTANLRLHVRPDVTPPRVMITYDGRELPDGQFVTSEPEIIAQVMDNNPIAIRDTANVAVFLNNRRLAYGTAASELEFRLISGDPERRAELVVRPELAPGEHTITFLVVDAFSNRTTKSVRVRVTAEFELQEVLNYPNPFAGETDFTFVLTQPADVVQIKIFTVNGRLIRTIEQWDGRAGHNQVRWDGRDADGDALANGIYLYKVIARQGNRQVEVLQKLGVLR